MQEFITCNTCSGFREIDDHNRPYKQGSYTHYQKRSCPTCQGSGEVRNPNYRPIQSAKKHSPDGNNKAVTEKIKSKSGTPVIVIMIIVIIFIGIISNNKDEYIQPSTSTADQNTSSPRYNFDIETSEPSKENAQSPTNSKPSYSLENNRSLNQDEKISVLKSKTEQLSNTYRSNTSSEYTSSELQSMKQFFIKLDLEWERNAPSYDYIGDYSRYKNYLTRRKKSFSSLSLSGLPNNFKKHILSMIDITNQELKDVESHKYSSKYTIEKEFQDYTVRFASHLLAAGKLIDPDILDE